jgi:hypothetical protein
MESQAEIEVEIGNFNHWCIKASVLVDLTGELLVLEFSYLYHKGLISWDKRLC